MSEVESSGIAAAVALERRLGTMEAALSSQTEAIKALTDEVKTTNGRVKTREQEHEALRDELNRLRDQLADRRLWERLGTLEQSEAERSKSSAVSSGTTKGVLLAFSAFLAISTLIANVVISPIIEALVKGG